MTANAYQYGYPKECILCTDLFGHCPNLLAKPYLSENGPTRIMLIGQDPTIYNNDEPVKTVFDLDNEDGQLKRWLKTVFGESTFNSSTIYATNMVKCTFEQSPSAMSGGAYKFLLKYFAHCAAVIKTEISLFKPDFILTFGEPAHQLFITILSNGQDFSESMKDAFTGRFQKAKVGKASFLYSSCLHITTYRVAEIYGDRIKEFKRSIKRYFLN